MMNAIGRAAHRDRLPHGRLPAELVHGGVEAHARRSAENGSEAAGYRLQAALRAQIADEAFFLELRGGVRALRLQVLFRTILCDHFLLRAVDARGRWRDEPRAGLHARF